MFDGVFSEVFSYLCREATEESVPEVAERECEVFVKEVSGMIMISDYQFQSGLVIT